ncbi:MAG: dTDP-6-deoxy-3,4-keto-hexulose isomerase [Flavipsychrobacter sp.]|jgi:mannose-6-phosphate isomerase-like protein (cupin superfamily)|nr:dTDP-6-deoxy-3,4-keto-hexulose isomerase [Flavipsychrobacter sp.]
MLYLDSRMKKYPEPHIIQFGKIGESSIGYISVAENGKLPFEIKRVFWAYYTPESIVRGRHAHRETEQILIATSGRIIVTIENGQGEIKVFTLNEPNTGVYIPPNVWHTMQYSHTAIQCVLASTTYNEADYIRDHEEFKKIWGS